MEAPEFDLRYGGLPAYLMQWKRWYEGEERATVVERIEEVHGLQDAFKR